MSWVEYIDSPVFERNDDGFIHATRQFKAWNYARSVMLTNPSNVVNSTNQPLLDSNVLGDNYIEIQVPNSQEIVRLFAYDMRLTPNSLITEIEVRYTDDIRLLSRPNSNLDVLGRVPKGRSGAFTTTFEMLPIMLRIPLVVDPQTGIALLSGWEEHQFPVKSQKNRVAFNLLLFTDSLRDFRRTVSEFEGSIVSFGSDPEPIEYFLFEGADYAYHSPAYTSATLFFLDDPGLVSIETGDSSNRLLPPADKTWSLTPGINYIRPPFQTLQMVRNSQGQPTWQSLEWHTYESGGGIALLGGMRP